MKLENLATVQKIAAERERLKRDFKIASSTGLVMMTLEGKGKGPSDAGKVVFTLIPPPDGAVAAGLSDVEVLFESLVDVVLFWHRRQIDYLTGELKKLGVEP